MTLTLAQPDALSVTERERTGDADAQTVAERLAAPSGEPLTLTLARATVALAETEPESDAEPLADERALPLTLPLAETDGAGDLDPLAE